jgi:hypothetical protein
LPHLASVILSEFLTFMTRAAALVLASVILSEFLTFMTRAAALVLM